MSLLLLLIICFISIIISSISIITRGMTGWRGTSRSPGTKAAVTEVLRDTANLPTNIVDFRGFDSSVILIVRGGIPRSICDFPESFCQAMLVGIILVGRLGVLGDTRWNQNMH